MSKLIEYIYIDQYDSFVLFTEDFEKEVPAPEVEKWLKDHGYFNWSHNQVMQEINDVEQQEGVYEDLTEYLYHNSPGIVLQDLNKFFQANVSA